MESMDFQTFVAKVGIEVNFKPDDYFLIADDIDPISFVFEGTEDGSQELKNISDSFVSNILGAYTIATFAWRFAKHASLLAQQAGLMSSTIAELKAAKADSETTDVLDEAAQLVLGRQHDQAARTFLRGQNSVIARYAMAEFLNDELAREGADAILRQSLLLTWSAFEVLASDLFASLLNRKPALIKLLIDDSRGKQLYQDHLGNILADFNHGADSMNAGMGSHLVAKCRLDNLDTIRVVFGTLFKGNQELRVILTGDEIWRLYQTRNLIVHRAAMIDEQFRRETRSQPDIGQMVRISPSELIDDIKLVGRIGTQMLKSANTLQ